MSKSINFFGQPIYGQLIKSLDREKIVEMSRTVAGSLRELRKQALFELFQIITVR